jgi:hypothetical protein
MQVDPYADIPPTAMLPGVHYDRHPIIPSPRKLQRLPLLSLHVFGSVLLNKWNGNGCDALEPGIHAQHEVFLFVYLDWSEMSLDAR